MISQYIGVTGFTKKDELTQIMELFSKERGDPDLMAGFLVSSKTLNGQPNRWPGRYPKIEELNDLEVIDPRVLTLIHYSTDSPETLSDELCRMTEMFPWVKGFQLNVCWPNPDTLKVFKERYPEKVIVLQVGSRAMKVVEANCTEQDSFPSCLADQITKYEDLADCVLLDPSGGKGLVFNPVTMKRYLGAIYDRRLNLTLGIAGGLDSQNLILVNLLASDFPFISIDAEGLLRTSQPEDQLDLDKTRAYVKTAIKIFEDHRND